jgi:hypothetical protein
MTDITPLIVIAIIIAVALLIALGYLAYLAIRANGHDK